MVSDLQTDDSRRDKVISKYMDAHASLPQCFLFTYGMHRFCQVEFQDSIQ